MQSHYSLSGFAAQIFPVRGEGSLAATYHNVSCSLRLRISDLLTSPTNQSADHETVTAEVEGLEYESSGLDVTDSTGSPGDRHAESTPQPQSKEIETVLFWKLAKTVASEIGVPVTKCFESMH